MEDYPAIRPPFVQGVLAEGETYYPFRRDPETMVRRWALPGQKGLEHRVGGLEKTHEGVLSTDPANHEMMVRERAEKVARIERDLPSLEVFGPAEGKLLVVGWGGTYGHIFSAVSELCEEGVEVSYAHFDYINPLPANTEEVFSRFDRILVCELNNGQFASYLRGLLPQFKYESFGKVQGQPFLVSELKDRIIKED